MNTTKPKPIGAPGYDTMKCGCTYATVGGRQTTAITYCRKHRPAPRGKKREGV